MGLFWNTPIVKTNAIVQPSSTSDGDTGFCPYLASEDEKQYQLGLFSVKDDEKLNNNTVEDVLNPLNNLPNNLTHERQPDQKLNLSKERVISTIPKGSGGGLWEYPSPQQMYNAMVRKGKIDPTTGEEIPEDAVESMVGVHNFLNEGCWQEILKWEKPHSISTNTDPSLLKFIGKPGELSPKARLHHYLSKIFPSKFSDELPFDRHDWFVLRKDENATGTEHPGYQVVRYVIDFYGGPDDEHGMPTFNLDVRPALDSLGNVRDRIKHYSTTYNQDRENS